MIHFWDHFCRFIWASIHPPCFVYTTIQTWCLYTWFQLNPVSLLTVNKLRGVKCSVVLPVMMSATFFIYFCLELFHWMLEDLEAILKCKFQSCFTDLYLRTSSCHGDAPWWMLLVLTDDKSSWGSSGFVPSGSKPLYRHRPYIDTKLYYHKTLGQSELIMLKPTCILHNNT